MTIVVPVAISLMAGGVDFGWAFATQATGSKSVHDAARYLGTLPSSAVCGWGQANAQNLAVYGTLDVTGNPPSLITNWQTSNVSIVTNPADCPTTQPFTVIVTATIPYTSIILASFLPISSTFNLSTRHEEPQVCSTEIPHC
jgi:Flp pilus assembly protein TadG